MRHIASVSFGKDSLAMLLYILDNGLPLDEVVFYNTGMEFKAIYAIRDKIIPILRKRGIKFTELHPPRPFLYDMLERPVKSKAKGEHKGYGWCGGLCRWGTADKIIAMDRYTKGCHVYVGIAADEPKRCERLPDWKSSPIAEAGMTEADCLKYCRERGYSWTENGVDLYDILDRVSCWCCANKNRKELKNIYQYCPEYWEKLKDIQSKLDRPMKRLYQKSYGEYGNVFDMEKVFQQEIDSEVIRLHSGNKSEKEGNAVEEIWKDVVQYPNYQVSNLGRVKNKNTGRMLKQSLDRGGRYKSVYLCRDGKENTQRVHRLVASAFLGDHPDLVVNHIDGDKFNNRVDNLEWCTYKENNVHAVTTGLNHPGAYQKRPVRVVETGEIFDGVTQCAKAVDADFRNVYAALQHHRPTANGLHFEYADDAPKPSKKPFLYDYQMSAVKKMRNGCILNGGVGSGKSRTGLYYYFKENGGSKDPDYIPMSKPKDLYIITTARKRDVCEWEGELAHYLLTTNPEVAYYNNRVVVDSWNNIKKYIGVTGAFFIFDEDRVTGSGAWVKAFLKIVKSNEWIILSATAGDTWQDYIPVFIANGFYKNKTEFAREHIVYSRFTQYPKIDRYINTGKLLRLRNDILVDMDFQRQTVPHHEDVYVRYDIDAYKDLMKNRWNPWTNEPIKNAAELCYSLRKVVNSDVSRQVKLLEILENHDRAIIFYSYDYELDILKSLYYGDDVVVTEWNGHKHESIPDTKRWIYLVQYSACEGWNCITTDTIIFFSQNYSYKVMVQAAGRIDRLNTPYRDLYYYHLKSRSGIDLAISKALRDKKQFNETKFVKW